MNDIQIAKKYQQKARNAEERGIEFTLSFQAFKNMLRAKKCYFTGIDLTDGNDTIPEATKRTIDRIDHRKPYESGNVVACCHAFNQFKAQMERTGAIGEKDFQRAVSKVFTDVNKRRGTAAKVVVVRTKK